jgi:hypothetical protein
LRSILEEYSRLSPGVELGSDETQTAAPQIRPPALTDSHRSKLKRDLDALNHDNRRYFLVCVAMIVLLFLVSVVVVLEHLDNATIVQTALAAFGVSAAGLITWMIKIWRVKTNTEFFMLLATQTDSDTMKMLINILAQKM